MFPGSPDRQDRRAGRPLAAAVRHRLGRFTAAVLLIAALLAALSAAVNAAPAGNAAAALVDTRIARHGEDGTQLVLTLTRPADYRLAAAAGNRVVIDLPAVRVAAGPAVLAVPQGLIRRMRAAASDDGTAQVVIETERPVQIAGAYFMKVADRKDYQLVLDLLPAAAVAVQQPPAVAVAPTLGAIARVAPKPDVIAAVPVAMPAPRAMPKLVPAPLPVPRAAIGRPAGGVREKALGKKTPGEKTSGEKAPGRGSGPPPLARVVVIDAGHGGKDPGAIGASGSYEKTITLAYARELQRQLTALGGYKVVLTRSRDVFIPLRERVAKARKANAELFLSIHADWLANPEVSGMTVFTLSEQASDAEAAALAERENDADRVGGISLAGQTPEAAGILIDVVQRQTMNRSIEMASKLVAELRRTTPILPTKPHRFAGFAVLKAADVPSVLIELGFLSNAADEARLRSAEHRKRVAAGIAAAVDRYFGRIEAARPPG